MKKSILSLALALAAVGMIQAKDKSEPVLMTINGKPVTLSEFEYLYHKNNSQQMAPQTIDEYLGMFITYKQKVAAAEDEGIDNTEAFKNEFEGYRRDLSEPYLRSQEMEDSLVNVIYNRLKEEVDISHIMMASKGEGINSEAQRQRLDSVRTAIINGADFEDMARRFSADRSASRNGGHMNYITAGRFPAAFEEVAFSTPVGEISPVFETPFGWHIIKVHGRRPAQGMVMVEHILKLTQGLSEEEAAKKKAQIDSIETLLANGADFEAIALKESEDPGSKRNGGKMNWFGTGQMVPEFEAASYALKNGEISAPVKTSYGWHIIKRLDWKPVDPIEVVGPQIRNAMSQDERGQQIRKRKLDELCKKFNASLNAANLSTARSDIIAAGGLDSTVTARFMSSNSPIAKVNGNDIPLSEAAYLLPPSLNGTPEEQAAEFEKYARRAMNEAVVEAERVDLAKHNPDYRNLINEYRDGMLLFEISDRNVWSKAKKDKEGLDKYFNEHKNNYKFESPKFKAYVVFATSDSVLTKAKAYLEAMNPANDSIAIELRQEFGNNVKVERVIAAKGENNITDYLGFGGPKPETKGRWSHYFPFRGKLIDMPEDVSDVRGAVTGDYQNELERQWVATLEKKYPAKINKKVLKKAK